MEWPVILPWDQIVQTEFVYTEFFSSRTDWSCPAWSQADSWTRANGYMGGLDQKGVKKYSNSVMSRDRAVFPWQHLSTIYS